MLSGCPFGLQNNFVEHLMDFGMVLLEIIEELAGHLQLVCLLVVPAPYQHFEPLLLQLGQVELRHLYQQDRFPAFDLSLDVGRVVNNFLQLNLELPAFELGLYFLKRSQLVGVVDVNEVGFDIVGNGFVVLRLPEGSLSRFPVQVIPPRFN